MCLYSKVFIWVISQWWDYGNIFFLLYFIRSSSLCDYFILQVWRRIPGREDSQAKRQLPPSKGSTGCREQALTPTGGQGSPGGLAVFPEAEGRGPSQSPRGGGTQLGSAVGSRPQAHHHQVITARSQGQAISGEDTEARRG